MNELANECMEGLSFLTFSNCLPQSTDQILASRPGTVLKFR